MSFADGPRMKLGLSPVVHVLAALTLLVLTQSSARASPRSDSDSTRESAREDALRDGDIDGEDIASQSPFRTRAPGFSEGHRVVPALTDSAWITLGGFSRRYDLEDRREVGGFVVVGLPLDRFARGNSRATSVPPSMYAAPEFVNASTTTLTSASPDTKPAANEQQPFELMLTPRLARSCVAEAWRAAGLSADDARLESIISRAHWSALLPETRLRAIRYDNAYLSLDSGTEATSSLRDSATANIGLEARVTWRFDRLLYSDDEPSIERIRLEQRDARSRIGARVLEALFHWQRGALDLRTLPPSQQGTRDEADVTLRVMEAEAALDVLTNGWFTTHESMRVKLVKYVAPVRITKPADL